MPKLEDDPQYRLEEIARLSGVAEQIRGDLEFSTLSKASRLVLRATLRKTERDLDQLEALHRSAGQSVTLEVYRLRECVDIAIDTLIRIEDAGSMTSPLAAKSLERIHTKLGIEVKKRDN